MATVPSVLGHSRISNSRWQAFPHSRTQVRKDLVVEEGTIPPKEVPLPMGSLARKASQVVFFIILAIFCNHLSLYRSRVSEWLQWNGKFVFSWRLYIDGESDFNSSATVSAICADQGLPGSCKFELTRGSSFGHELYQGPT